MQKMEDSIEPWSLPIDSQKRVSKRGQLPSPFFVAFANIYNNKYRSSFLAMHWRDTYFPLQVVTQKSKPKSYGR